VGFASGTIRGMSRHFIALACALSFSRFVSAAPDSPSAAAPNVAATSPATRPTTKPVEQAADGTILLHSRDVTIHGTTVRYEPKPEKNTVGFWTKKEDWVSWDFRVTTAGKFHVLPLQGCGKGSGGSDVEFSVGEQTLKMTVEDTGGFQKFVERDIGTVELKPGTYTLSVKPQTKPHGAVMDLRQVTLKPDAVK
jgi:arylsulfatase A